MITIHSKEISNLIGDMLDLAWDEFVKHVCNDLVLDNTPEMYTFVETINRWADPDENPTPRLSHDESKIYTRSTLVTHYLSCVFKGEI